MHATGIPAFRLKKLQKIQKDKKVSVSVKN